MDARLVLVWTVLLVGSTSEAMQVFEVGSYAAFSTEKIERLLSDPRTSVEMVAQVISLANDQKKYEELIKVNSYNDSDCTQAEVEQREIICTKYSGKLNEYCRKCVGELSSHCAYHPHLVLIANVGHEHLVGIESFEREF
jgi:hypothetical protein